MFDNKSVFVVVKQDKDDVIYKLEVDDETQKLINRAFDNPSEELESKQRITFDGRYTPLEDESLCIPNFVIPDFIKDAIRNPISVDSFYPNTESMSNLKYICVGYCENTDNGEKFVASFQKFRKEQYISTSKINLFFDNKTFVRNKNIGIAIGNCVDCIFSDTSLIFTSFYYARQIFDLSGYYRTATDSDIDDFLNNNKIDFKGVKSEFNEKANSWIRRRIALINDSGVLDKYEATEIKRIAKKHSGIDINVKDKKIVFPHDFEQQKLILSFLDEESWKGAFSNETFVSTSKRKITK